jgi:hypothetical protein
MRVGIIGIALAMALSACSTPPASHSVTRSKTYPLAKDAVWESLMAWFTTNQLAIKTIEKDSGVVYAERIYATADAFSGADCGKDEMAPPFERIGQFNVFVHPVDAANTQVTVNSTFIEHRRSAWDGSIITAGCVSTGALENSILTAIH